MSIANIVVARDKALIAFDTKPAFIPIPAANLEIAMQLAVQEKHTSKCGFLVHANVAMPTLGDNLLANYAFSMLQLRPDLVDLDKMAEAMPEILATAYGQATTVRKQQWGIEKFPGSAVFLVGWSNALKRMECVRWTRWPADSAFKAEQVRHVSLNPDTGRQYDAPITDAEMEKIAREQVTYARGLPNTEYDCGGRLLVAELTRDTLNVRTVADLEGAPHAVSVAA
jgi:hypothetical protein